MNLKCKISNMGLFIFFNTYSLICFGIALVLQQRKVKNVILYIITILLIIVLGLTLTTDIEKYERV